MVRLIIRIQLSKKLLKVRVRINNYFNVIITITPHGDSRSASSGMYPIEDGIVIDESNDWGLGKNVPVNEFKAHLMKMIDNIKNFSTR